MTISKESLWAAFEEFDNCGNHSHQECKVLAKLFHIAIQIERGDTPEVAMLKCKDD